METLSLILLIGCVIAILVAMVNHWLKLHQYRQQQQQEQEQEQPTTLARLDFEDAERALAKAKLLLNIIRSSQNTREAVLEKALENVDHAAEEWVQSLKQVLQLRRRNRSPSPETKAIYDRFRPKINTVESN